MIGIAPRIPTLGGFVSAIANVWPSFCLRLFRSGESQLEDALVDRCNRIRATGGLRALKALLRMGCRAPLIEQIDQRRECGGLAGSGGTTDQHQAVAMLHHSPELWREREIGE